VNEIEGTRRTFTGYALMALQKEELYLRLFNELISLLGVCRRKPKTAVLGGALTPRGTEIVDPGANVRVVIFHSGLFRQAPSESARIDVYQLGFQTLDLYPFGRSADT